MFCKYRTDELETFLEDFTRSDENENDCTGVTIKSTLAMEVYICSQEVVMITTWITIEILNSNRLKVLYIQIFMYVY